MSLYVVGVDVGGTNIKLGIVHASGKVIARNSFPTQTFASSKIKMLAALASAIEALITSAGLSKKSIQGIGIGLPGLIDHSKGIVRFLPNIHGWRNVPLKSYLEKKLGLPVHIDNDVKMITLAEWKHGAGKGVANLVCLTLGTGVGSGLIFNNKLYRGEANAAGELGHVPLNEQGPSCNCGGYGCFERYVGNRWITEKATKLMGRSVTLEEMYHLAKDGNAKAREFWHGVAVHIGNGLVGVVNLLSPRLIIIGGGISNNEEYLFPTIKKVIEQRAMDLQSSIVRIKRAKFGDDAGIIGAQVLVNAQN